MSEQTHCPQCNGKSGRPLTKHEIQSMPRGARIFMGGCDLSWPPCPHCQPSEGRKALETTNEA